MELFLKDLRTYQIMMSNQNYYDRLLEAYQEMKSCGISTLEEFTSPNNHMRCGAFTYYEISIFDRISTQEYAMKLSMAWEELHNHTQEYINDPQIGDKLASWGTLGETPFREEYINKGLISR